MKTRHIAGALALLIALLLACGLAGAEERQLEVQFPSTIGCVLRQVGMTFDDDWFDASSDQYQHEIAQASLVMAMAAFRDENVDLSESDHYLKSFFEKAGFEDYQGYGYSEEPTGSTISNGIAACRREDERGAYVLLAVPVCGQGYGDEWLSNFTVADTTEHAGFGSAAAMVYQRILSYIDTRLEGERVKVWVTGFSRAAAVSNLLSESLLGSDRFDPDDIFVYTFGTPNTTLEPKAYPQVYNICGSFDPVPKIPFAEWGYGKHGITMYITSWETDATYVPKARAAAKVYASYMGSEDDFYEIPERNGLLARILGLLYECIPDRETYALDFQDAVIAAWTT